ncbi:phage tail sheath family protein [Bradyrhizobium niftali]|uniref:Phage tail sheath family protein n=1 Tax=Bradyrhizobium niftali TaxID=2560055 RepID=A0A4Y9M3D3_9BRAD|nr:phage tail sheath C-terminal domain-containing protein [Bradyrhizobium niftali]TFV49635.1 phage tail sheath family protein [Bradyrhizobium niftali]
MYNPETPGVYWRPLPSAQGPGEVRLDVPAFVGIAERGPLDKPVRVRNLREFEQHFGEPIDAGFLAYAVRAFFENEGQIAWIVRVASRDAATGAREAGATLLASATPAGPGTPYWSIRASSPGSWGNRLSVAVQPGRRTAARSVPGIRDAQRLKVTSVAGFEPDCLVRLTQGLSSQICTIADIDAASSHFSLLPSDPRRIRPWHQLLAGLDPALPIDIERLSATLIVKLDMRVIAEARDLSFVPDHPRYGPTLLALPVYPARPEHDRIAAAPFSIVIEALDDPGTALLPLMPTAQDLELEGGQDGLSSLSVSDFTGLAGSAVPTHYGLRGLATLENVAEPAILAIPDACIIPAPEIVLERLPVAAIDPCDPCGIPQLPAPLAKRPVPETPQIFSDEEIFAIQQAMVEHCESRRDRIALIDPPWTAIADKTLGIRGLETWRQLFDSNFAAFYAPWLKVVDPRDSRRTRTLPPSGHAAGQYAMSDHLGGIQFAPANRDIAWAQATSLTISDAAHGLLNRLGINVIRTGQGHAPRILGSRLMTSDAQLRDIPVRRTIILLRRAFERILRGFVFEPNAEDLRERLGLTIEIFMTGLWNQGAFAGTTAQEAFAVICDDTNNSAPDGDNGRLICDVAFAPVHPLEFVVLRIGVAGNEIETNERLMSIAGGVS